MKKTLFLTLLTGAAATLWAGPPAQMSAHTIRLVMSDSQVARTARNAAAQGPWYRLQDVGDFLLSFPITDKNTFCVNYPRPGGGEYEVSVSYTPITADNKAHVSLESADFNVGITLSFTGNSSGSADIRWHEAGETRHFRNICFSIAQEDPGPGITLPEESLNRDPELWDDGLQNILQDISETRYHSTTDKLYQKRLISLLPLVMVMHDASYTTPDFKGNTALHYACALSHTNLVRWLVNHGADLEALTEKGASIDACISGINAQSIRDILAQARRERDYPLRGPQAEEQEAAQAVKWLETAFTCADVNSPLYEIPLRDEQAQQHADLLYLYVRQNRALPPHVDQTEPLGNLLTRLLRANMHRGMFSDALQQQLYQLRANALHELQKDGKALAMLPHMMLQREAEGMNYDACSVLYRACMEGNVALVSWLLEHGVQRRLTDKAGNEVELPTDIPNAAEIRALLQDNGSAASASLAPALVAGKTFCFSGHPPCTHTWKQSNNDCVGAVRVDSDWCIINISYTRTGNNTATITRCSQWSPGGTYAADSETRTFHLSFTSDTEGSATCTVETKTGELHTSAGSFTLQ